MTSLEGTVADCRFRLHPPGMNTSRWKALAVTTALTSLGSWAGSHAYGVFHAHGRMLLVAAVLLAMLTAGVALVRRA